MVCGVLTLILSWASLGADVATAVVSTNQQACYSISDSVQVIIWDMENSRQTHQYFHSEHFMCLQYVMLFGFYMLYLRRVTVSPSISKACLCGRAWQIIVNCCLLAWRRWYTSNVLCLMWVCVQSKTLWFMCLLGKELKVADFIKPHQWRRMKFKKGQGLNGGPPSAKKTQWPFWFRHYFHNSILLTV